MISRQLNIFIIIGISSTFLNYSIYSGLFYQGISTPISKFVGFVSGMVFSYFGNKIITFNDNRKSLSITWRFVLVYATGAVHDVGVNEIILFGLDELSYKREIAFVFATLVSATVNFLGMKLFVFKPSKYNNIQ
jgi:putative flippase GtrA